MRRLVVQGVQAGIYGAALQGGRARLVRVEAVLGRGLSRVILVGMPDAVAREARERLPAALARHGFAFPRGKVLFNLVPAQWPKGGLPLDLALAMAVLVASGEVPAPLEPMLFLAELDLEGRLGPPARGTLLAAMAAHGRIAGVVTAPAAAFEAALAPELPVWPAEDLAEAARCLTGPPETHRAARARIRPDPAAAPPVRLDEVRGQSEARRAAIIAAAGRHPMLLQGPPGTGKSLLARRVPALLPTLTAEEALELAQIEALLGPVPGLPRRPPFRAPHASVSAQGVLGGGHPLRPGEISRAHRGVLFLDELPEFARPVLEGLRQPLEDREVRIQRAGEWAVFPADALLIAARNPCPCGYLSHPTIPCVCTPTRVHQYRTRTSGPLLDRFDLFVEMGPVKSADLHGPPTPPHDEEARKRLQTAQRAQGARCDSALPRWNGSASREELEASGIAREARSLLEQATDQMSLSGRGALRCLRVSRTIADLGGAARVERAHVLEALNYRCRDAGAESPTGPSLPPPPAVSRPPNR